MGNDMDIQHNPENKPPPFSRSVQIVGASLIIVVFLGSLELMLRYFSPADAGPSNPAFYAKIYTAEEMRRDLPQYTEREGQNCIKTRAGVLWEPRFGYSAKQLDRE